MLKDAVAIIDLGYYSLTAMIGENGINNNYTIRAIHKTTHEAFEEDTIVENRLYQAISESLKVVTNTAKARLDKVYVGIPGNFLKVFNTEQRLCFNRKRRIRDKDVSELFDGASYGVRTGDYEIISRSGVCYFLDGNMRCEQPIGAVSASLSAYVTLMGAKVKVLDVIRKIFRALNVSKLVFLPVPLAEGKLLFSGQELRDIQILLDVGYLSSSLTVLAGGGALFHTSFEVGGGHVTAYLYNNLKIKFDVAERLKRKINLSIHNDVGNYVVVYGDSQYTLSVREANDITRYVLDMVAENFDKEILNSRVKLPHNVSVSLTGGGISYIRGGTEYLSGRIEMPVNVVSPKVAYMCNPDDTSALAVLNYALNEKIL